MTLEADAQAVGDYLRHGGGWGIGYKVARWVETGAGQGARTDLGANAPKSHKVSCRKFAELAGVDHKRIARYLKGWNAAADAGLVPHSWDILPDTEWTPDEDALGDWSHYLRLGQTSRTPADTARIALGELVAEENGGKSRDRIELDAGVDRATTGAAGKLLWAARYGEEPKPLKPHDSERVMLAKCVNRAMRSVCEFTPDDAERIVQDREAAENYLSMFESVREWADDMVAVMEGKGAIEYRRSEDERFVGQLRAV